jgi:hypothetical protein
MSFFILLAQLSQQIFEPIRHGIIQHLIIDATEIIVDLMPLGASPGRFITVGHVFFLAPYAHVCLSMLITFA